MTSSLVGSEMCIRDSNPWPEWSDVDQHDDGSREAWLRSWAPQPAEPVSYTHLTLPTICSV
eukprot:11654386-Prorocentrum_lima.AAC.1